MAFRADEAASRGFDEVKSYLVPRQASIAKRKKAEDFLHSVVDRCGPVVDKYPLWHPLVYNGNRKNPSRYPDESCGYHGLDHTRYFAHGFITCPYNDGKGIISSVQKIDIPPCAYLEIEEVDVDLYMEGTKTILVRCEWPKGLEVNHLIPKSLAVPLMLEREVPVWRWAKMAETWENMRTFLLGEPHGNRSSLFVGQDTALAIKKIYISLVESGMYGPIT